MATQKEMDDDLDMTQEERAEFMGLMQEEIAATEKAIGAKRIALFAFVSFIVFLAWAFHG